jgi:hypothetical protein
MEDLAMIDDFLHCQDGRRDVIRKSDLVGLDYVDVSEDQRQLTVHLIGRWPDGLDRDLTRNVVIDGGRVIRNIEVLRAVQDKHGDHSEGKLKVTLGNAGDFTTYTLRLAQLDDTGNPSTEPLPGFDPRYSRVEFNFKSNCPSDADCGARHACTELAAASPVEIDYLAKDYTSFRRVVFDRLAVTMPTWASLLLK